MRLSIILVNYNERDHLRRVLRDVRQEFPDQAEILVVDNASADDSATIVAQEFPDVRLLEPGKNLFYGKGANVGLAAATGDWLMVMNPDVRWEPGQLRGFIDEATGIQSLGLAAPQVRYDDGRIQITAHRRFPTAWTVLIDYCLPLQQFFMRIGGHPYQESLAAHTQTHQIAHATGVCILISRRVYETVGGFDPQFSMYLEETEWQRRMAAAGVERWFIADWKLTHFGSAQKTFAQASPHYIWGMRRYAELHWPGPVRAFRLLTAMWVGALVSIVLLLCAWPLSWFLGRAGRRIRHYVTAYGRTLRSLLYSRPVSPEVPS